MIDLQQTWRRAKYKDLFAKKLEQIGLKLLPKNAVGAHMILGAEITKDYADFEVTGAVFEKLIEPTLIQPTFVTHLPKELVPLAKLSPDDPTTVEVFECCINGQEISPGYTEQNDPSSNANASNIRPAASSKNWTRIFWSRSNTACRPPAALAWALTGCA